MSKPVITNKPILDLAEYNGVKIWRKEGGSIEVSNINFSSVKAAIMDIAANAGIIIQEDWNTQYAGWFLIKKLKERYGNDTFNTQISKEYVFSRQYDLDVEPESGCVVLSIDNVAKVEAMIRNDSDYIGATNKSSNSDSSARWLMEVNELFEHPQTYEEEYEIVKNAVAAIDRENSTHINADTVGISELSKRLLQVLHTSLFDSLKNPKTDNYHMVELLAEQTDVRGLEPKYKSRKNYSFASKFCHYACFYLFEGMPEQDNFSIYDSVVASAIPLYAKKYQIEYSSSDLRHYPSYINLIDSIIERSKSGISRNGFDHLLWYYYKARPDLVKKK